MMCENCNERPATFHVVEITDNEKREVHLCEKCAHEKKIALPPSLSRFSEPQAKWAIASAARWLARRNTN